MSVSNEPSITLSPEEKRLYGQLFKQCDPEGLGIVTGEVAKTLFSRSGLAPATLGEIWQLSDSENQGFLNQIGFSLALRIIGQVQGGQPVSASLGEYPGPLPKFDGQARGSVSSPAGPGIVSPAPIAAAQVPVSTGGSRVPALNPNDRTRFIGLFSKSAPNGYLDGDVARNIFLKARLPNETLGQIWNLADTEQRGSLNQAEFVVAMHLIQCTLNGSMKSFPDTLPPALFEAAAGRPASRQSMNRASSSSGVFQQPVARQYTGGSINSGHRQPIGPASAEWQISPKERARFDGIFNSLDTAKKGTIGAGEVVPFLTTSKLPEEALAQVWDLADVNNMGEFTKNEFAIAMYLVQQRLQGRQLPSVLPQSLLYAPNSRQSSVSSAHGAPNPVFLPGNDQPQQQQRSASNTQAPPPARPVPQQNNSSINDLAQLNDLFSTPTPPATAAFKPASPVVSSPRAAEVKHFVPTSTFGQSITRQDSGLKGQSPQLTGGKQLDNNNVSRSLLGDDVESAKKLSDATTEFGNLSNQISSLTTQTVDLQTKRQGGEQELQQMLARKQEIEGKLAALRSNYDEEVRKVKEVEQQLTQARQETQQKTQEFNVLEASFNALHAQFEQSTAQLTASQQENDSLKEKISATNEQVTKLKSDLENAEKELKQHQNRIAVNQQQLATSEADRTIAENDLNKTRELVNEAAQVPTPPVRAAEIEKDLATGHESSASPPVQQQQQPPRQNSANPFFSGFGGNAPFAQPVENVFDEQNISDRQRAFEESFGRLDVTSPSTVDPTASSRNTVDTPNSSPPASDFQYNAETNSNAGFTLPIVRPESATSSVQNNPPLSQRGDISQPGTPDDLSNYEEKQNQVDQLRQGSLATLTAEDEELYQPSSKGDDARHSTDSFEMVNAETSDKEQGDSSTSDEVRREDIVGASVIPGGFPPSEAATSEISTKDWAENQQYNTEFSPIHEVEHLDESSSDDEGPEDITKGAKQFNPVTAGDQSSVAATAGDDNNDVGANADSTSSLDGNDYTSAPSSPASHPVVVAPVTGVNIDQYRPDESHIQTPKPAEAVPTEQKRVVTDPFASAFNDLSEAKQDPSDIDFKFNNDYDDFQATFDSAFENIAPAVTTTSTSTAVAPASLPAADPATSNDEWEQLFAGFSNNAPGAAAAPVASTEEINSAFKLPPQQQSSTSPATQGIPPAQGLPPAARAAPLPNRNTPHSQAILELTGMGFSQQDAIEALHKKDFDLAEATNYLLDK